MFFRNALIYRLTQSIDLSAETVEAALATKPARPCASQEVATYGFTSTYGKGPDTLARVVGSFILISARKEEKLMPGPVIKREVQQKVEAIEQEQLRKVYKKERDQIKDEVIQAMLPRAFVRQKTTFALLMPEQGLIIVEASSPKEAEDLLSTLRESLGSLPIRPVTSKIAPSATLTDWIKKGEAAQDFYLLDYAILRDSNDDGGKITATGQDLTSDEIQLHLSAGKLATKTSLAWQEKLSFYVDDRLIISRLRFEDLLTEQAERDGGDDSDGQIDASLSLMALTFAAFVPALLEAFGGEVIPQGLDGDGSEEAFAAHLDAREHRATAQVQVDLEEAIAASTPERGSIAGDRSDGLFAEVVAFVRETRRASISAVQRKFKIGYNRAARLIETLEIEGVVTAMTSNGSREVIA